MSKLQFNLTFYGGKADEHRVPANKIAELISGLSEDIVEVCRLISYVDVTLDIEEIKQSCKLYVVAPPKPSSLTIPIETEDLATEWPVKAGHTFVQSLRLLSIHSEKTTLPVGITLPILQRVKKYCPVSADEFSGIRLSIPDNGMPGGEIKFDESLLYSVEKAIAHHKKSKSYVIEGHMIDGILYSLQDQRYNDPTAKIEVGIDTDDGLHWVCHIKRELLPDDLDEIWKQRVLIAGTASIKKTKLEIDVETFQRLERKVDLSAHLSKYGELGRKMWAGIDLSKYMDEVRERHE